MCRGREPRWPGPTQAAPCKPCRRSFVFSEGVGRAVRVFCRAVTGVLWGGAIWGDGGGGCGNGVLWRQKTPRCVMSPCCARFCVHSVPLRFQPLASSFLPTSKTPCSLCRNISSFSSSLKSLKASELRRRPRPRRWDVFLVQRETAECHKPPKIAKPGGS